VQILRTLLPARTPLIKIPLNVSDERLLGGLDLVATLRSGRASFERGLLCGADGGLVFLPMAERLTVNAAAKITMALDLGEVVLERDGFTRRLPARAGVVALDEGLDSQEHPPAGLLDRLAFHLDLDGISAARAAADAPFASSDIARARMHLTDVRSSQEVTSALCAAASELGIGSARAPWLALRVARAAAALHGRGKVADEDTVLAARLVLAPRALRLPSADEPEGEPGPPPSERQSDAASAPEVDGPASGEPIAAERLEDLLREATSAALPPNLLAQLQSGALLPKVSRSSGRAATKSRTHHRGRPMGTRPGEPVRGARMNVLATLRAAAPWQKLRRSQAGGAGRIQVRKSDFRVGAYKHRTQSITIFLVDASGSAALHRLGEAKGAIELMLSECYVRRDQVALIAFRGKCAQLQLPPTRSLARARRELASLPGGGGTPLASGLDAARTLAETLKGRGEAPILILLTDGQANVGRDGKGGRGAAEADALSAARLLRGIRVASILIDTAQTPRAFARRLAAEMDARYLALPHADAISLAKVVSGTTSSVRAAEEGR
jgi:magnesium chelatase subunit D